MLRAKKSILISVTALLLSLSSTLFAASIGSLFHPANASLAGNPKGGVTIVEFFDYRCTHCASSGSAVLSTVKSNPNVRVIFVDYPILGESSTLGARAALAAKRQGKYVEFSHALLTSRSGISQASIMKLAESMGLDTAKLKKDMFGSSVSNEISANIRLAHSLNVYSTPAFFIGKTNAKSVNSVNLLYGGMSQSELQDEINHVSN